MYEEALNEFKKTFCGKTNKSMSLIFVPVFENSNGLCFHISRRDFCRYFNLKEESLALFFFFW